MLKSPGFLVMGSWVTTLAACFPLNIYYTLTDDKAQSKNNPPIVKIVSPNNNSVHEWNSLVRYSITVSDAEDGESRFEEVPSNEVFLEIKYVEDALPVHLNQLSQADPLGLEEIKKSNCFTCHAVKSRVIGPSFEEIAKKYSPTPSTREMLAKRITGGSTGVWGTAIMPSHQELKSEEARQMVDWILKNCANPNLNYIPGTTGAFRLVPPPGKPQGLFVLSATYRDHGLKDKPNQNKKGRDVIVIIGK